MMSFRLHQQTAEEPVGIHGFWASSDWTRTCGDPDRDTMNFFKPRHRQQLGESVTAWHPLCCFPIHFPLFWGGTMDTPLSLWWRPAARFHVWLHARRGHGPQQSQAMVPGAWNSGPRLSKKNHIIWVGVTQPMGLLMILIILCDRIGWDFFGHKWGFAN